MASGGKCQIYGIGGFLFDQAPFLLRLLSRSNFLPHMRTNVEQNQDFKIEGENIQQGFMRILSLWRGQFEVEGIIQHEETSSMR